MAEVAEIEGLEVLHLKPFHVEYTPKLFHYFENKTMSVHLKERVRPMAKVGRLGEFRIKILEEDPLTNEELRAALEGDMRKTADLLLMVRPDYTVYDELR